MANRNNKRKVVGFTLIELMIVIAIIGILSAVAIPNFMRYQLQTRRTESFTNLVALAHSQKAYYAEWASYISVLGEPITTTGVAPNSTKRPVAPVTAAFSQIGWTPEGDVFFDYDSCAPGGAGCACACTLCFTVSAWSDLDNDGSMSGYMYFEPDTLGGTCQSAVGGHFPPVYPDGTEILQTATWHGTTDNF